MKNNMKILITTSLLGFCLIGYSQNDSAHVHKNEISIAVGIVPIPAENELTAGLHLHYIRGIGKKNRFGLGVGLESIIDEHKHFTLSAVLQYRIYRGLALSYAPGILMRLQDDEYIYQMAHHIEITYEFELDKFHIGPVAEVGIEQVGVHYMLGVHIGVDFH